MLEFLAGFWPLLMVFFSGFILGYIACSIRRDYQAMEIRIEELEHGCQNTKED
jgi:hypothetical protein